MADSNQVLDKGLYLTDDGELVTEAPENGRQIVAPGLALDDVARGLLKAELGLEDGDAVDAFVADKVGASSDAKKKPAAKAKADADADAEGDDKDSK